MSDMTTILNVVSTFTLIGALVFTGLQVRTANRARAERATLAIIEVARSEAWTSAVSMLTRKIPNGMTAAQIDALDSQISCAIEEYGLRLESIGYMVFTGIISLETVERFIGGITVVLWSRLKPWVERDRERSLSPRQYEWFQWVAERLAQHRRQSRTAPSYIEHDRLWIDVEARRGVRRDRVRLGGTFPLPPGLPGIVLTRFRARTGRWRFHCRIPCARD